VGEGEAGPSVQAGAQDERSNPEENVTADEAALGAGEDEAEGERQASPNFQASAACEPSSTEEDGGCTACPVGEGKSAAAGSKEGISSIMRSSGFIQASCLIAK
jgi:hypothetical protein